MDKHLALIVDDEEDICELLELTLNRMDINTYSALNLKSAYQLLSQHNFSICLTDMRLPDGDGIALVKHIKKNYPHIPTAMISAHGNMDTAIEALKSGAFDFVSKPVVLAELRNLVNSAIALADHEQQELRSNSIPEKSFSDEQKQNSSVSKLLGNSEPMKNVRQLIVKLSKSQAPVHITGESGTGKELAAQLIHQLGHRKNAPFIPINCGAIPSELMESEFFGHKKGSFTGAIKDKMGFFLAANGGTLFLDEIADLPLNMQVKLLRAIQEKSIRAIGDEQEKKIDVRIISATHKDLKALVEKESFRQDLYYRINVIELAMPSLKESPEDISLLSQHYLEKLSAGKVALTLSEKAQQALLNYPFPGNVRELENILERAITLCENNVIDEKDLKLSKVETTETYSVTNNDTLQASTEENELQALPNRSQLVSTLDATKWNRKAAASLLGITYRQLRYRLKKFGIE